MHELDGLTGMAYGRVERLRIHERRTAIEAGVVLQCEMCGACYGAAREWRDTRDRSTALNIADAMARASASPARSRPPIGTLVLSRGALRTVAKAFDIRATDAALQEYLAAETSTADKVERDAIRAAFALIDKNGDGVLTRIEVIKALKKSKEVQHLLRLPAAIRQEDGTRDAFEKVYQKIDVDDSKSITREEFEAYFLPPAPPPPHNTLWFMLLVVLVGVLLGTVVAFALRSSGMAAADGLPPQAVEAAAAGLPPADPEPAMSDDAVAAAGVEAEPSLIDQAAQ